MEIDAQDLVQVAVLACEHRYATSGFQAPQPRRSILACGEQQVGIRGVNPELVYIVTVANDLLLEASGVAVHHLDDPEGPADQQPRSAGVGVERPGARVERFVLVFLFEAKEELGLAVRHEAIYGGDL
eukprot:CAMPEP_0114492442 /NCGR_PEP_ID=MMETSP0109-20121206/3555_1 /TAXON_ID=29199 /ORGANISM="Chlorarachnion reptans, Strain CCCM449" /LENGTH=127 /DNA_ID=CAMNT_0001669281 /DNA_START=1041 /DNA_END=1424 /DNA_ORIENTATION=+